MQSVVQNYRRKIKRRLKRINRLLLIRESRNTLKNLLENFDLFNFCDTTPHGIEKKHESDSVVKKS
jgi:hypothetical protein